MTTEDKNSLRVDIDAALAASRIDSPQLSRLLSCVLELKAENARLRGEKSYLEGRIAEEDARCSDA